MNKKEKLNALLQPYLNENVVTEIPNERKMAIDDIKDTAETYDAYDEIIKIMAEMQEKPFADVDRKILEKIVPPIEIVNDDVDICED